ncbi:hypothetical protein F7725_005241 [Dissostichus mawsoni]|uniref:Uncharacterized protein n=1 Tax=Dissostichus mawsoni TaxID=36200 RepID=A0A7J5YQU3_DISMA|nr:hypothetical protein F7725_005241 [Dissostichus mawsoni]
MVDKRYGMSGGGLRNVPLPGKVVVLVVVGELGFDDVVSAGQQAFGGLLHRGGAGQLLVSHHQLIPKIGHLSQHHCILVLALHDEVLQTLCHVQLALCHLLYPQTKL